MGAPASRGGAPAVAAGSRAVPAEPLRRPASGEASGDRAGEFAGLLAAASKSPAPPGGPEPAGPHRAEGTLVGDGAAPAHPLLRAGETDDLPPGGTGDLRSAGLTERGSPVSILGTRPGGGTAPAEDPGELRAAAGGSPPSSVVLDAGAPAAHSTAASAGVSSGSRPAPPGGPLRAGSPPPAGRARSAEPTPPPGSTLAAGPTPPPGPLAGGPTPPVGLPLTDPPSLGLAGRGLPAPTRVVPDQGRGPLPAVVVQPSPAGSAGRPSGPARIGAPKPVVTGSRPGSQDGGQPLASGSPAAAALGAAPAGTPAPPTAGGQVPAESLSGPVARQLAIELGGPFEGPDGSRGVSLQLQPESLGEVRVTVTLRAEQVQIELHPVTPAGHSAIAAGLPELERWLASQPSGGAVTLHRPADQQGRPHSRPERQPPGPGAGRERRADQPPGTEVGQPVAAEAPSGHLSLLL